MLPLRSIVGAIALPLLAVPAAAGVQTEIIDFFPDEETNIGVELVFIRPHLTGRTIVETRLILEFTPAAGFDSGDLNLLLTAPVDPAPGATGFVHINTGDDLGWSGPGMMSTTLTFSNLNGVLQPGVWTSSMLGEGDPPILIGSFGPNTRWEVDTIPAPGAIALAALSLGAWTRRRR